MTYQEEAVKFLDEYLTPWCPVIPDLPAEVAFPWDHFCRANLGLMALAIKFDLREGCQLSEHQCSWACMVYRWRKLHINFRYPGEAGAPR